MANWILHGSPLGFDQAIQRQGIFPASTGTPADEPTEAEIMRDAADWENWPSAMEEKEDLLRLIREAEFKARASAR